MEQKSTSSHIIDAIYNVSIGFGGFKIAPVFGVTYLIALLSFYIVLL